MINNEIQEKLLIFLKKIKNTFDNNNIRWYGVGGTAIGSLREQGFILWDDDIDLAVHEDDFERAMSLLKKEHRIYDKGKERVTVAFGKVFDENVEITGQIDGYLSIDIFCMYRKRKIGFLRKTSILFLDYLIYMRSFTMAGVWKNVGKLFSIAWLMMYLIPISANFAWRLHYKLYKNAKVINSDLFACYQPGSGQKLMFYSSIETFESKFEDILIPITKNFIKDAHIPYGGSIMVPPEKTKQVSHGYKLKK